MESFMEGGFGCELGSPDVIQDSWNAAFLVDEDFPALMKGGFCMRKA
jgi:hypothetical protein